jgi:hypothetical protein
VGAIVEAAEKAATSAEIKSCRLPGCERKPPEVGIQCCDSPVSHALSELEHTQPAETMCVLFLGDRD